MDDSNQHINVNNLPLRVNVITSASFSPDKEPFIFKETYDHLDRRYVVDFDITCKNGVHSVLALRKFGSENWHNITYKRSKSLNAFTNDIKEVILKEFPPTSNETRRILSIYLGQELTALYYYLQENAFYVSGIKLLSRESELIKRFNERSNREIGYQKAQATKKRNVEKYFQLRYQMNNERSNNYDDNDDAIRNRYIIKHVQIQQQTFDPAFARPILPNYEKEKQADKTNHNQIEKEMVVEENNLEPNSPTVNNNLLPPIDRNPPLDPVAAASNLNGANKNTINKQTSPTTIVNQNLIQNNEINNLRLNQNKTPEASKQYQPKINNRRKSSQKRGEIRSGLCDSTLKSTPKRPLMDYESEDDDYGKLPEKMLKTDTTDIMNDLVLFDVEQANN